MAVGLTDEARHALAAVLRRWTGDRPLPGRPVPPENWHLTLRFLGWVDPPSADRLAAALDEAELGEGFRVTVAGAGVFPNPRRATVLWTAVTDGAEELATLAERVEETAEAAGLGPADRPFRPHLTLSRLRPHQDLRPLLESAPEEAVRFPVRAVTLYRSHLGRGGARYEPVEHFPLD